MVTGHPPVAAHALLTPPESGVEPAQGFVAMVPSTEPEYPKESIHHDRSGFDLRGTERE